MKKVRLFSFFDNITQSFIYFTKFRKINFYIESSILVKRILQKYSTLHLFTKALVEHLILRRIEQMRKEEIEESGKEPYPLIIFRSNYIGPSAVEPMPGWVRKKSCSDSMTDINLC
jgi:hypothetical protein